MKLASAFAAILLVAAVGNTSATRARKKQPYNCNKGCGLNRKEMGPPVCGEDDNTYYNECLAFCQGITVSSKGPCPDDAETLGVGVQGTESSFDEEGVVDKETMEQFKDEGFKFVGKRKFLDILPEEVLANLPDEDESAADIEDGSEDEDEDEDEADPEDSEEDEYDLDDYDEDDLDEDDEDARKLGVRGDKRKRKGKGRKRNWKGMGKKRNRKGKGKKRNRKRKGGGKKAKKIKAMRVTEDGYEYVAEFDDIDLAQGDDGISEPIFLDEAIDDEDNATTVAEEPQASESEVLSKEDGKEDPSITGVVGSDSRYYVRPYYGFPQKFVGEIDYGTGEGGCTGTVLYTNAVLTAGHCVYDPSKKAWMNVRKFAPGRYRTVSGTREPYGVYYKSSITTYSEWATTGSRSYDMAVIRTHPYSGRHVAERTGYAGISHTRWYDSKLDYANIMGYPYDKPDGMMYASGRCSHTYSSGLYLSKHYCDTMGAMSGSAVMSSSGYIYGIHVAGMYKYPSRKYAHYNIAVIMYGRNYYKAKEWAGR